MAVTTSEYDKTFKLKDEFASCDIIISRRVAKGETRVETSYPVKIKYDHITYEVDEAGTKVDIYERVADGEFSLEPAEVWALFSEVLTTEDGTRISLGDLIGLRTDSLLQKKLGITPVTPRPSATKETQTEPTEPSGDPEPSGEPS